MEGPLTPVRIGGRAGYVNEHHFDPVTDLFPYVVKPGRYCGNEPGLVVPDPHAGIRILLVHPGEYGSAVADLDYQRLYYILNLVPGVAAERGVIFDKDVYQRLAELGLPPFSLETRTPWTDFDFLVFYIADPLDARRIPRILTDLQRDNHSCPPVIFISAGAIIPHFLSSVSGLAIGDVSFSGLLNKLGAATGFDAADAVKRFATDGESRQIVALTGTQSDELKIPLVYGPLSSPLSTPGREPACIARDMLIGLGKSGLENVRFIVPDHCHYPQLPDVFSLLSQRANLAHLQIRVPPVTAREYLEDWVTIRPRCLKSELPLIFPGGERIDDVESHPLAEAGRQALVLGWQVLVLVYRFRGWNEYRGGLSSVAALADYLVGRCKSYEDKRSIRIMWAPATGTAWRGPLEYDERIRSALTAIAQGAGQRLSGVPMDNYFDPHAELFRQFLLRVGPDFCPILSEKSSYTMEGQTESVNQLFTDVLEVAQLRGVNLPEVGRSINSSSSPFLSTDGITEITADCYPEPRDLPTLTEVFGRRKRKASFTRRLTAVPKRRLRVQYAKTEQLRFFSHLDVVRMVERAIQRSRIPVEYSAGFHPRPKISFGPPLPWGAISQAEYFDVVLDADFDEGYIESLKANFPEGLNIVRALALPAKAVSLFDRINVITYRVAVLEGAEPWDDRINKFMGQTSVWLERTTDTGTKRVNLRPNVRELKMTRSENATFLEMEVAVTDQGSVRPAELVAHLGSPENLDPRALLIERVHVFIQEGSRRTEPMACT